MPTIRIINASTDEITEVDLGSGIMDTIATYEEYERWHHAVSDPIVMPTRKAYDRMTVAERQTIRTIVRNWDEAKKVFLA